MIYKNSAGELWCQCGNRIHEYGFYPVDAEGNLLDDDQITGDEKLYRCDRCGVIVDLDHAPVQEEPDAPVLESDRKERIELRLAKRSFLAFCGHEIQPRSRFLVTWVGEQLPWTYCSACAPKFLKVLLQTRLSDSEG